MTETTEPKTRAGRGAAALLLTPGAGGGRDHHTLMAIEDRLAPLPCLRLDFPNRLAGKRAPDRPPAAIAHVVAAATEFAAPLGIAADQLLLGGRSFGGRMCSMAVAQGLPAAGLVLLSYPLHPPGQPAKLRIDHFPAITVPVLFLSGDRDPFGSPAEFAEHTAQIAGRVTFGWLRGGHDPRGVDVDIAATIVNWVAELEPAVGRGSSWKDLSPGRSGRHCRPDASGAPHGQWSPGG